MIRVIKNFLEKDEIEVLNSWCLNNYDQDFFIDAKMDPYYQGTRLTTRRVGKFNFESNSEERVQYPQEVFFIQKRLIKLLGLRIIRFPIQFRHGIVNGIGFENGSICSHVDPIYYPNTYTVHCNILTQKPIDGGIPVINGVKYDTNVGDVLIYTVSHLGHEVTQIIGKIPRILWSYGFCVIDEDIKNIFPYQDKMSKNA
jgi:hypothetical protein